MEKIKFVDVTVDQVIVDGVEFVDDSLLGFEFSQLEYVQLMELVHLV